MSRSHVVNDDDAHPITGERLADEGGYGSDDAPELFSSSAPSSKNNMLSSLLTSENIAAKPTGVEPFAEWDSLPSKYLVSDAKSYLAYFKVSNQMIELSPCKSISIFHHLIKLLTCMRKSSIPIFHHLQ